MWRYQNTKEIYFWVGGIVLDGPGRIIPKRMKRGVGEIGVWRWEMTFRSVSLHSRRENEYPKVSVTRKRVLRKGNGGRGDELRTSRKSRQIYSKVDSTEGKC